MDHDKKKLGFPNLLSKSDSESLSGASLRQSSDFLLNRPSQFEGRKDSVAFPSSAAGNGPEGDVTNLVSVDLSESDKREIYDAIDLIRRKLSFAREFTEEERANLMRLGKTGRTFVEKAQDLVERSPGILPRSFDVEEFKRDADLYQELGNISDELHRLAERVADTEAAVGSDAFTASLVVYQSGKLARTGDDMDNHLVGWRRKISDSVFD